MPLYTPLGFGFPTATPHGLTSRHAADSQAHSSKGTPSHTNGALTDCKHMVSGTISLPSRGTFHHSLTVLNTLSVTTSYQTYRTVPADSQQIPRAHCYSGTPRTPKHTHFTYRTLTYSGRRFHTTSATRAFKAGRKRLTTHADPTTPHTTPQPRHHAACSLVKNSLSFATTHKITIVFLHTRY